MTFETPAGSASATADVVLGADGAGSAVRGQLLGAGLVAETLDFLDYGYKELTIPPAGGEFAFDPGALHIWPRGTSMMIALPNPDRSFTCTLFWPNGGRSSFASLSSPAAIEAHFREHYPDVVPLMPTLVEDYQLNPVGLLGTVHVRPWQARRPGGTGRRRGARDRAVLRAGRELRVRGRGRAGPLPGRDRRVLGATRCRCSSSAGTSNTEAIARMALANFVEMRDKVASPVFRLGKRVEHALERTLPGVYVSRYELVSFSTTPYADIQRRVARQHRVLGALAVLAASAAGAAALATSVFTNRHGRARSRGDSRTHGGRRRR